MMVGDKIRKKISKYDIISFDLYDTLLIRPFLNPCDLFKYIESLGYEGFYASRISAESEARSVLNEEHEDTTIDEIYSFIDDKFKKLKSVELNFEVRLTERHPINYEIYLEAVKQNKKIIFVTDMYLSRCVIKNILKNSGYEKYDKLYISSEVGKTKRSSNLYKYIICDGINPRRVLHIGDDIRNDIRNAQKYGFKTHKVEKYTDVFLTNKSNLKFVEFIKKENNNLYSSILVSIFAKKYLENKKFNSYDEQLGYYLAGVIGYGYVQYINQIAEDSSLIFVSRDGYLLSKIYNKIVKNPKPNYYLPAQRILYMSCFLDYADSYHNLKALIEIIKKDIPDLDIEYSSFEHMKEVFNNNIIKLISWAKKKRLEYQNYLDTFNIEADNILCVDMTTGFFTSLKFLQKIFENKKIRGVFFSNSKEPPAEISPLIYASGKNFFKSPNIYYIVEQLFTSYEKPILGVKNNEIIYSDLSQDVDMVLSKRFFDIEKGALKFVDDIYGVFENISIPSQTIVNLIYSYVEYANCDDIKYFKMIPVSGGNPLNTGFQTLYNRISGEIIMTHKKPRILQRIFSIANEGFYKKIIIFGIKIKLQNFKYRRYLTKKYISPQGIIDNAPCGFKQYLLKNNMPEKIELLKSNLDEQSIKILNETLDKILNLPDYFYAQYYKICPSTFNKRFMTVVEKEYIRKIAKNEKKIKREYRLSDNVYDMEVFINHHGLSYASKKIREYIQDKDFIDAGAFIGDSALVFLKYNPRKIYSFEISKKSIVRYKKTMAMNNVPKDKYELIEKGLSDKVASKFIFDSGNMNVRVFTDNGEKIELVDLDSFVQSKNLNIGFIKADVEGALLDVLRGMKSVIRNNRPVMSLAIYHSPYEFFEAKPLLDSYIEDLNYKIELRSDFPSPEHIYGTVLWAYPKELC